MEKEQEHNRWLSLGVNNKKICPKCKLPMEDNNALNSLSLDGKTTICSLCGQIESLERTAPHLAEGLKIALSRAQAAVFGLDKHGDPKLPKEV